MKITIAKGKPEATEQLCVNILLATTIISFIGAILIHLLVNDMDFWANILLGISASAFISFITIYIPFYAKEIKEITQTEQKVAGIYLRYKSLIIYLNMDAKEYHTINKEYDKEEVDSALIDFKKNEIPKFIDNLMSEIKEYTDYYNDIAFITDKIRIINDNIHKIIFPTLRFMKMFYDLESFLDSYESTCSKEVYIEVLCRYTKYIKDSLDKEYKIVDMLNSIEPFITQSDKNTLSNKNFLNWRNQLIDSLKDINSLREKLAVRKYISKFLSKEIQENNKRSKIEREQMAKEIEEMEKNIKKQNENPDDAEE